MLNRAILLCIFSLIGLVAFAQTRQFASSAAPAPDGLVSLDTLIATALRSNPEIEMSRYESLAAGERIGPASRLPDPQLKIGAMNVPTDFTLTSDMMTMAPQVTLMQMFPWFGKLGAAGDVQRYDYASATDRLSRVRLDVVKNLKQVYGETYRVEKTLSFLEYKKQLLQSVVKVAEQLFAVGQVPQQDVFRATAELTMAQSDILMQQSALQSLRAQMGALLGENAPRDIQVDTLSLPHVDSLALLRARLAADNPDLKQIKNNALAAGAKAEVARKDAVPDLSLGISYGYRGARMPNGAKALNMLNFEVGVTLPIHYGSRQQAMIDEADFMEQAAQQQYRSVDLALDSRLNAMYAEAESQRKLLSLYSRELIPQYEAAYSSSVSAYAVGKTTFAMVIDNLTTLINTKIEYVKTESSYFSTIAEISRLVGETVEDTGGDR